MSASDHSIIYKKTQQYVTALFEEKEHAHLVFHCLEHTENVVNKANEIAGNYDLDEEEMLILYVAAWFHDTGYLFVPPEGHEEKSASLMQEFMQPFGLDNAVMEKITACIMATKPHTHPANLLEQILRDADTYHFGTKDFKKNNKKAFSEFKISRKGMLSEKDFNEQTIAMLQKHKFYTDYCIDLLSDRKKQNMKKLKSREQKLSKKDAVIQEEEFPQINEKQGTTKGMQTMLRLTSSNHIQLSEMADNKANILISVNAIIISVILSVLLRKLQTDPYLTVPTIVFLLSSVATIVVSILATRPKVSLGTFADEDVQNKKTNLLFFGNFHKMPQADYENAMRTMMNDPDYLYSSIVQDIYHLGIVLGRKYKLIRIAYNIFMWGIILSVIAFGIAAFINSGSTSTAVTNSTGSPF
jgi:predicted metal-dependent HD superfamily phosphohydrolase